MGNARLFCCYSNKNLVNFIFYVPEDFSERTGLIIFKCLRILEHENTSERFFLVWCFVLFLFCFFVFFLFAFVFVFVWSRFCSFPIPIQIIEPPNLVGQETCACTCMYCFCLIQRNFRLSQEVLQKLNCPPFLLFYLGLIFNWN